MNWGEIITHARAGTPYAKIEAASNTIVEALLYSGIIDVARHTKCLPENITFDVTADTYEYLLSANVPRFLLPDRDGLYWNNGTRWKQLIPKDRKWLDSNITNWRNLDSGDPYYYYIEGNKIGVHPTPDTTLSDGFWLYYFAKPAKQTDPNNYVFEGSSQIPNLEILDMAIIKYFRWHILSYLGKNDEYSRAENQYKKELAEKIMLLTERPDIAASPKTRLRGRRINQGF